MVLEEHLGVLDGVLGADEDEGDGALLPRHGRLGLVVPFDLDSDHSRLVDDLLDEATVLADRLSDEVARHLILEYDIYTNY